MALLKNSRGYCRFCKKHFSNIKEHHETVHQKKNFRCEICGKAYESRSGLLRHIQCIHKKIKHKCKICGKEYSTKHNLKVHFQAEHEGKRFKCEKCGKTFKYSRSLRLHKQVEAGVKYRCRHCGKYYTNKEVLKIHIRQVHKKIRHECKICGKSYSSKVNLKRHVDIKHKKTKDNAYYQKWHLKKRKCEICGKEVANASYKRHLLIHTGIKYRCYLCGSVVVDIYDHMRRVHPFFLSNAANKDGIVILTENEKKFLKRMKKSKSVRAATILEDNLSKKRNLSLDDILEKI